MRLQPTGKFNNGAKLYDQITVIPLASAMGAKIEDVDLSNISKGQFKEISDALFRHKMIYFCRQELSHGAQEEFTLRFGDFGTDAYTKGLPGYPNIQPVIKEAETRVEMIFGEGWHTDSPFLARPPAISMLYGVDLPPYGGDTIWANTELAYDYLSVTMKKLLAPLKVHMSAIGVVEMIDRTNRDNGGSLSGTSPKQGSGQTKIGSMDIELERQTMIAGSYHPLVRTHPVTKKKSLYIDATYAQGFEGMTEEEAKPLLEFLISHITQASFTCRLHWKKNTFVVWDNRSCLHQAFNDYDGYRREMYRTTVLGEKPA